MSFRKISIATLLLINLTACSGGGSSNPSSGANPTNPNEQLVQTEAELSKVKAELQNAEAEKKTAAQKLATAQRDLQKAEADKTATVQELATAKANLNTAQQSVANANREKQAVENVLNSAKSALEAAQRELQKAQTATTEATQAKDNAEKALADKTAVWNEIVSKGRDSLNSAGQSGQRISSVMNEQLLPAGLSKHPFISVTNDNLDGIFVGNYYVYVSPLSDMKVFGRANTAFWNDEEFQGDKSFRIQQIRGTLTENLPSSSATYKGVAFAAGTTGNLSYVVDFGNKTAEGRITGFNNGLSDIQLQQGKIGDRQSSFDAEGYKLQTYTIESAAHNAQGDKGLYRIDFFGQNAESLGGKLYMNQAYEGVPTSNGTEQTSFNAPTRGTVFGLAAEKQ